MKRLLFPLLLLLAAEAAAQPADASGCASCHGSRGEGGLTGAPRLAGLPLGYLARQLAAYADGSRQHSVMTPIAQRLTSQEREALDAYYSALRAPPTSPQVGGDDPGRNARSTRALAASRFFDFAGSAKRDKSHGWFYPPFHVKKVTLLQSFPRCS